MQRIALAAGAWSRMGPAERVLRHLASETCGNRMGIQGMGIRDRLQPG